MKYAKKITKEIIERLEREDLETANRLNDLLDLESILDAKCRENYEKFENANSTVEKDELCYIGLVLIREYRGVEKDIENLCKDIYFNYASYKIIDRPTQKINSPVAEASRILTENFEVTSSFGSVNSKVLSSILNTSLSTAKIHKAVLDNFDGVKFRKQKRGYTYTLRRI